MQEVSRTLSQRTRQASNRSLALFGPLPQQPAIPLPTIGNARRPRRMFSSLNLIKSARKQNGRNVHYVLQKRHSQRRSVLRLTPTGGLSGSTKQLSTKYLLANEPSSDPYSTHFKELFRRARFPVSSIFSERSSLLARSSVNAE